MTLPRCEQVHDTGDRCTELTAHQYYGRWLCWNCRDNVMREANAILMAPRWTAEAVLDRVARARERADGTTR